MEAKTILQSRTFWAQVVAGLVLILPLVTGKGDIIDEEAQTAIVGGLWAVANVILRLLTSTPVTLK